VHRYRKTTPSQEAEWTEEPTAIYRAGPRREGSNSWVQAQSLDAVFERARASGEALPTAFVFAVYVQACAELAGTGRRPARHREDRRADPELSPDRIYVGFDGQVKIDWARDEPEEDAAAASSSQGRPTRRSYLSPEQLRGLPTNGRSDLYSLALCIAELFVLKRLSDGRGPVAGSEGGAEFAELLRSGTRIPRDVGSILLRSLARDLEQRPFGVTLLLEDLERIGEKLGLRVHPSTTAAHMRRLFLEPRTQPPPPLAPTAPRSEYWGDFNVFSSLAKPRAPAEPTQMLPPPPVSRPPPSAMPPLARPPTPATTPRAVSVWPSRPPAPPPAPGPRPQESEPPQALARTVPPAQTQETAARGTRAAEAPQSTFSRSAKAVIALLVVLLTVVLFPKTGAGRVVALAAGHWGEPLPNAVVIVDGEQKCSGARCAFDVSAGVHELTAKADGYVPQLQLVAVRAREPAALNFRLERGGSSLRVSGEPDGASVLVDGERVGRLPTQVELAPGSHSLRVEAEHYLPEERVVELAVGDAKSLPEISLRPMIGKAKFDVRTPGVEIALISGTERKDHLDLSQPIELDLSRKWTLEAKKEGYQGLHEPLDWEGDSEKTFVVALDKAMRMAWTGRPASRASGGAGAGAPPPRPASGPDPLRAAMLKALDRPGDGLPGSTDIDPGGAESAPVSNDPCLLTFNSIPVSNVFLDNVRLGTTPILKTSAKPGAHVVQFLSGETRRTKAFACKPGESKVVAVSLNR